MDDLEFNYHVEQAKKRILDLYYATNGECYISFSGGKDSTIILELVNQLYKENRLPNNSIKAVFSNTHLELQATIDFVKWVKDNYYSNIVTITPKYTVSQVFKEYGVPAISKMKSKLLHDYRKGNKSGMYLILGKHSVYRLANKYYHFLHDDFKMPISDKCCDYLKKKPLQKYQKEMDFKGTITGVRAFEGGRRELVYNQDIINGKSPCISFDSKGIITKKPIIDWNDEVIKTFISFFF